MENNYPGQLLPIIVFSAITILYIFIKYHNSYDIFSVPKIYFFIYLFSVILSQIFINVYLTKKICGSEQFFSSFLVTFIPWILIFVSLNFMIYKFPGWLKPFSNTFGYLAISYSLTETFNKILKDEPNKDDIEKIYGNSKNQNLIVNEIPIGYIGFDNFISHLKNKKLLKEANNDNLIRDIQNFKKLVMGKNIISEFIWFMLTGILVIMVSYNYIIKLDCSLSYDDTIRLNNEAKSKLEELNEYPDLTDASVNASTDTSVNASTDTLILDERRQQAATRQQAIRQQRRRYL